MVLPEPAGTWLPGLRAALTTAGHRGVLGVFTVEMGTCKLQKEKTHHTSSLEVSAAACPTLLSRPSSPCVWSPFRSTSAPFPCSPASVAVQQCYSFRGLHGGGNIFISTAGDPGGLYIWEDTNLWSKYFILVLSSKRDFHFPLNICEILLGHFRVLHIRDLKRHFLLCQ